MSHPKAADVLLEDLKSGSPGYYTPRALAITGDRRAVPHFIKMLYSERELHFNQAFYALAHLGDERATPRLFEALTTKMRDNDAAIKAFSMLKGSVNYVNYAMSQLRESYWFNSEWIELVLERGNKRQKNELAEILIGKWHPLDNYTTLLAGPVRYDRQMIDVAYDMLRLTEKSDKRLRDKIVETFYVTTETHSVDCVKKTIANINLHRIARIFKSEKYSDLAQRSDRNFTLYSCQND